VADIAVPIVSERLLHYACFPEDDDYHDQKLQTLRTYTLRCLALCMHLNRVYVYTGKSMNMSATAHAANGEVSCAPYLIQTATRDLAACV
jgi:hypothetical protein